MILWRNIRISDKQHQVLTLIYSYRGLTNEHLRELIFGHLDSEVSGQKANISRYTAGLRKLKMIDSFSCYPYSKELIHCLSPKGTEYVKEKLLIDPECELAGFDQTHFGDFDATMLKPGLKNLEHTMMFLDFAIQYRNKFNIRHNLYSVKEYEYLYAISNTSAINKKGKVRPDGEIKVESGNLFAVEIDTGSERYPQLVAKFENYRKYLDYCILNDLPIAWKGILFVCKDSPLHFKNDQRIHTILRAASEGLKNYSWTFTVQIYRGGGILFGKLLRDNLDMLNELNIPIPPKNNPILEEKRRREERKRQQEDEERKSQEAAEKALKESLRRQELEKQRRQQLEQERREQEINEEKKNSGLFGRLFS